MLSDCEITRSQNLRKPVCAFPKQRRAPAWILHCIVNSDEYPCCCVEPSWSGNLRTLPGIGPRLAGNLKGSNQYRG